MGAPPQSPPEQVSPEVQASPSLQELVLFVAAHAPVASLQKSSVHIFPSLQMTTSPTQLPPEQRSLSVHRSLSLQGALLFVLTQLPVFESQLSNVQTFPSSQFVTSPAVHTPPAQTSPTVQASPSLQSLKLKTFWHAPPVVQLSVVQG